MFLADLPQTDDRIAAAARGDRAAAAEVCREILPRVRQIQDILLAPLAPGERETFRLTRSPPGPAGVAD